MRRIAMVCLLVLLPVFSLWGQIFEYKEDTLQVYPDIFEVLRSRGHTETVLLLFNQIP